MDFIKLNGGSYYIDAPTNIGVYVFKNKNCMLIDSGINNTQARKIDDVLKKNNLHVKYIVNTHSHMDHCGGNHYFTAEYPGCIVYAASTEGLYMENPHLYPSMLFSSNPIKDLWKDKKPLKVDFELKAGVMKFNDEKFEIIPLPGHSPQNTGILTSDKVCYLGDCIFSKEILSKYSFPYLYSVEDSINTLNMIKDIDGDYFVIGHSDKYYTKDEILKLSALNLKNIQSYIDQILELLEQPLTREDLLENLLILNNLTCDIWQYHIYFSSLSAFVSYLYDKDILEASVEDGKCYYYQK